MDAVAIHCQGCNRRVGYAVGFHRGSVKCSTRCLVTENSTAHADRNAIITALHRKGLSATDLAEGFDVSRNWIYLTLREATK